MGLWVFLGGESGSIEQTLNPTLSRLILDSEVHYRVLIIGLYICSIFKVLQHRSVLFAPLNFRTRLFNLVLIFAVLVCASLCFLIFARFVSTPNFRHNAQLFCFFAEF